MKQTPALIAVAALLLASCGEKDLVLASDTVDRAATCGIVAAATARTATNIQSSLKFADQGKILHYALLGGSATGTFSPETATAVSKRMSEMQEEITGAKWQTLKPECDAAYPEVAKTDITLPAARFDAQLGCDALADFMMSALQGQEADYGNELGAYRQLRAKLNVALGPGMAARAGSDIEAQQVERRKALATMAKLGSPTAVMAACTKQYGEA